MGSIGHVPPETMMSLLRVETTVLSQWGDISCAVEHTSWELASCLEFERDGILAYDANVEEYTSQWPVLVVPFLVPPLQDPSVLGRVIGTGWVTPQWCDDCPQVTDYHAN